MSRSTLNILVVSLIALMFPAIVAAQTNSYVSAQKGSDVNPCSSTLPCRTFTKALNNVLAGGSVIALDSGDYSAFTVTKSVSIIGAPGIVASIIAPSGIAIKIEAAPSDTVVIRGLLLNGGSASATTGILVSSTIQGLHIENVTISNFFIGIDFASPGYLSIQASIVRDNINTGALIRTESGLLSAAIDSVTFEKNGIGLQVGDGVRAIVRHSAASGNGIGFATSTASATTELNLDSCLSTNTTFGILSSGLVASIVRVTNSTVVNNFWGILAMNANNHILSRGNNTVEGNFIGSSFTGSFNAK